MKPAANQWSSPVVSLTCTFGTGMSYQVRAFSK